MAQNQNVGQGALFKNDKQGVESRPDYTGSSKIWDKEFFVSAWVKTSQTGKKYLSLAFKEKTATSGSAPAGNQAAAQTASAPASSAPVDDDIPF